jgi:hypothetical protein
MNMDEASSKVTIDRTEIKLTCPTPRSVVVDALPPRLRVSLISIHLNANEGEEESDCFGCSCRKGWRLHDSHAVYLAPSCLTRTQRTRSISAEEVSDEKSLQENHLPRLRETRRGHTIEIDTRCDHVPVVNLPFPHHPLLARRFHLVNQCTRQCRGDIVNAWRPRGATGTRRRLAGGHARVGRPTSGVLAPRS